MRIGCAIIKSEAQLIFLLGRLSYVHKGKENCFIIETSKNVRCHVQHLKSGKKRQKKIDNLTICCYYNKLHNTKN